MSTMSGMATMKGKTGIQNQLVETEPARGEFNI
jgi:hypothetical protein